MKSMYTFLVLITVIIVMPLLCLAEKSKCCCMGKRASIFVSYANAQINIDLEDSPLINVGFNDDPNYIPFREKLAIQCSLIQ